MARRLIVKEVQPQGSQELACLSDPYVSIGRDASTGLVLAVDCISRVHGSLIQGDRFWLYADEESTNGSWLNGKRLYAGQWQVLRSGDRLQLADIMLEVTEEGGPSGKAAPTLIVVDTQGVHSEFELPAEGTALVLGGAASDLPLDDTGTEDPLATFEIHDGVLRLVKHRPQAAMALNRGPVGREVVINNNDCLEVGPYQVVFADGEFKAPRAAPASSATVSSAPVSSAGVSSAPELAENPLKPWDQSAESSRTTVPTRGVFGRSIKEASEATATRAITPEQLAAAQRAFAGGAGGLTPLSPEPPEQTQVEDIIIMVLGVGLIGVLLGFGIWWLLR